MCYVYILQSIKTGSYYIGSTINTENRLEKHNKGYVASTKNGRPWDLKISQKYQSITQAKNIEYRLKRLKRRDYIEKMIKDGYIRMI
ncbi:excinuclease ABC subunit C [Candidatus Roizmanbacteria bacterium CG_4_9_14_0_2_um_filter_39_13]|uniref:Excinuclease ABC subunit C n=2 Tax=Candidatus Roizmaniibacteriota TaxID=1752723 RepID=A0A2M8F3L0_9BACT|nr:MAG: excinuclease ABC subunit C [Candidatus Roizmanbacteria bacterium CG_4_10_14_0_2_um_filter_39_12]PJC33894.1 MAG: excinuclease ABC subunit C [Candidatus Roizmanbacteria bacterium CG_4_9_14_0_2_um_filter_39_13]PJE61768.1 MAG: excinuclease ABC subunit C [Candidatus Roizmanbacteria bacterium CG10_big_fil_rev_8_21_14_0_10_39_12]